MHPAEIKCALQKANSSLSKVARELGITNATVSSIVYGKARSARVEKNVSKVTGLPLSQLWPQWHAPTPGNPAEQLLAPGSFRARLTAELDRLAMSLEAVALIARVSVADVQNWQRGGDAFPSVPSLILLAQATRIDLCYVMTGRRLVAHG